MDADVGIIGVGTMGAMAAWQLADRGVSVLGFEQFAPGHDRSAAGGETRIFRTVYKEGAEYVPLLVEAREQWRNLGERAGRKLLDLNGFLNIGHADSELVAGLLDTAQRLDLEHSVLDAKQAARAYPQHALGPDDCVVVDPAGGYLKPELAVLFAAAEAEKRGARIWRHERVLSIEPDSDGVTIVTDHRRSRVGTAIVTTGPWGLGGLGVTGPGTRPQRIVMTWFAARDPRSFSPDVFPPFVREGIGTEICGWPSQDGETVKVAIVYPYDQVTDPDHLDRDVDPRLLTVIHDAIELTIPGLVPEPTRIGVYMDGYNDDGHAVVGWASESPNTLLAYGFSGHGFKMSPVIGRILADLVTDGSTDFSIGHLSPSRQQIPDPSFRTVAGDMT